MTMVVFQKSIPLDIIRQACADHDQNIMFVEALFKNQKDLPFDIIRANLSTTPLESAISRRLAGQTSQPTSR